MKSQMEYMELFRIYYRDNMVKYDTLKMAILIY